MVFADQTALAAPRSHYLRKSLDAGLCGTGRMFSAASAADRTIRNTESVAAGAGLLMRRQVCRK